jgi:hypothetical protein
MNTLNEDIITTADRWIPVSDRDEAQVRYSAYSGYAGQVVIQNGYDARGLTVGPAFQGGVPSDLTPRGDAQRTCEGFSGGMPEQAGCFSITITAVVSVNELGRAPNVLRDYESQIASLPIVKQAELFKALNKIGSEEKRSRRNILPILNVHFEDCELRDLPLEARRGLPRHKRHNLRW